MRPALVLVLAAACSFHGPSLDTATPGDATAVDAGPVPACHQAACHRLRITIHHALVAETLHDFAVLLHVHDPDLANASGPDLTFTDGATVLPYERASFAGTDLVAWVGVPTLSSTADTVLYLYYGDPAAPDGQDPTHVWDAHAEGVWHLDGTARGAGAITDSTVHGNHGSDTGTPMLGAAGQLGGAVSFDGVDDGLIIPASTGLGAAATTGTISCWVSWTQSTGATYQRLLMSANTFAGDTSGFEWATNPSGGYYFYPAHAGGAGSYVGLPDPFGDTAWHLAALTLDLATSHVGMYLDGQPLVLQTDQLPGQWTTAATSADWLWGGGPNRRLFSGRLDELRVASVVRSAGWLATEWANQHDVDAFATATP